MKATIKNIRLAYNDTRRFANTSSNTGIVEFTHAVRKISYDFYNEIQTIPSKTEVYKFIREKMIEKSWDGFSFKS